MEISILQMVTLLFFVFLVCSFVFVRTKSVRPYIEISIRFPSVTFIKSDEINRWK
jgi:hypothetical protein